MAFQANKKQDSSPRARKSFIPAPKIYSKSVPPTTTETVEAKEKKFVPGDRVCISGIKKGFVFYFGRLHVSDGLWCGIELDDPEGLNDGQIEGIRYFSCRPSHGIFAPIDKVERVSPTEKSYTTWAKVSNVPEKKVEHNRHADDESHKAPLAYETLKDGILEEQPPFEISAIGRKSVPRASLKHQFEHSKLQHSYQQQQQQPYPQQQHQQQQQPYPPQQQQQPYPPQQQQPYPQQQQQQQQQQPYPQQQQQYFQYSQSSVYNQQQYAQPQYATQQYPQQQMPPPQYLQQQQQHQQQQQNQQPQYPLQQIPPYPQQYPCQQLQPPYPTQQALPPAPQQCQQQPQPPPLQQQPLSLLQQQPVPPLQQQYHPQIVTVVQQTSQQHVQAPFNQKVGPTIQPQQYQQYPQQSVPPIQDQQQHQPLCQPASPKYSSVYVTHDKPSDGFNPEGGGGGRTDSNSNGCIPTSVQNQTDIELSATVKEYLESDRRTYFNFTFDGDSSSSRSASTIPDSLTSSAYQAEQELDPVGAIWELENTDDEVSFRLEEAASESSSLTNSTEDRQVVVKVESNGNLNNSNSLAPPTENVQEVSEEIIIQRLERELHENIAKKENYYKSLSLQSSGERGGKDSAEGQSKKEVKSRGHGDSNQVFSNILDSGYEPDTVKQPYQIHGHLDNCSLSESVDEINYKKAPPIMTDSGIIVREESESGYYLADSEKLGSSGVNFNLEHLSPNDQLAADLRNGHKDKERPISLISTTSVDTGYVPDTDSEVGTVMNSPVEKLDRTIIKSDLEGEAASSQDSDITKLKEIEAEPKYHDDKHANESEIPKDDDEDDDEDEIESDNKDVEQHEGQNDSGCSSKIDHIEDNKKADISKQERDSSSQEKDSKQEKQADSPKDGPATKSKKNATNKEKAGSNASDTARARSKSTDRKTDPEKSKNFLLETKSKQEKVVPKVIKRAAPKSKWDSIMNKIETNKENVKLKPKTEVKSKLETYLSQKPVIPVKEKKVVKEAPPKKVTHIPLPDYSKVKSKLFSATASSATKQRPTSNNKKTDVENVLQEVPEGIGSSTVSINSIVSSKSNHSAMGTSRTQAPGKSSQLRKQSVTKSEKGKIRSKVGIIKTERPESAASSRTDVTQNSVKSMNAKNVGRHQTGKNVNVKSSSPISSRKSIATKPPVSGRATNAVNKNKTKPNVAKPTLNQSKVSDHNKLNNKTSKSKVSGSKSDKVNASEEITRLEALCETRTKDLNYTKLQLKSSLSAFDAMAVLVNYLANELDAFACPTLMVKLSEVQKELSQAEELIENLKEQQAKLEQDIVDCNQQHEKALADLINAQHTSLLNQKELLTQQNSENLKKAKEQHAQEIERMKAIQAEKKIDVEAEHKNNMDNLRLTHFEAIRTLQRKHENQMEDLHCQHRDKLEEITHTFESIKMTLSEKVESLRCECEEFRNRARMCEEALEQEANVRVQTALSPYRDLPREIESLKTVLEMRNGEIHDLRSQKIELEKQLEELPPALEKITLLQQKIENLEAILQIKSDHEKQLNEKCQSLMRKFNKETRANKRLSMEFDELKWRMSQSELSGSQENILKMYSCSPSGSESGSPDPTRRFSRSPKHWDHKDGGGDQLSSSVTGDGSMESKVKRRSGTFIVHDRPSPLSSPKSKSASGSPAIQMSQSWAGTGESTTNPSPEDSLILSPPQSKSLTPPENSLSFLEVSASVTEQPPLVNSESVSTQEKVTSNENK